mgnify:CR=1 FL=1
MASRYADELAEWVSARPAPRPRQDRSLVAFLAVKEDVRAALEAGYAMKTIWAHLHATGVELVAGQGQGRGSLPLPLRQPLPLRLRQLHAQALGPGRALGQAVLQQRHQVLGRGGVQRGGFFQCRQREQLFAQVRGALHGARQRLAGLRACGAFGGLRQHMGLGGDDGHGRAQLVGRVVHQRLLTCQMGAQSVEQVVECLGQPAQFALGR